MGACHLCCRLAATVAVFVVAALLCLTVFDADGVTQKHGLLPEHLRPSRPIILRALNGVGSVLGACGLLQAAVSLEPASLVEAACRDAAKTTTQPCALNLTAPHVAFADSDGPGTGGHGSDEDPNAAPGIWAEGLRQLTASLEAEAKLTLLGRIVARGQITEALRQRAVLIAYWATVDGGAAAVARRIQRPVIIVGLPRTGTTMLQEILSQHPRLRAPRTWELMSPVPPVHYDVEAGVVQDEQDLVRQTVKAKAVDGSAVQPRVDLVQWNIDQVGRREKPPKKRRLEKLGDGGSRRARERERRYREPGTHNDKHRATETHRSPYQAGEQTSTIHLTPRPPQYTTHTSRIPRPPARAHVLEQYKSLAPGLDAYHPIFATRPEECLLAMSQTFDSQQFAATYNVPSYMKWLLHLDNHRRSMRWHRRSLGTLQGPRDGRRWVFKSPYYLALLDDIRSVYPDAVVIQTHRDPSEVLASSASVHAKTYGVVSDDLDLKQIGQQQVENYRTLISRATATRAAWKRQEETDRNSNSNSNNDNTIEEAASPTASTTATATHSPWTVLDVHLADLQKDPVGTAAALAKIIFDEGAFSTADEAAVVEAEATAAFTRWAANNGRGKHGRHTHSQATFGIDVAGDPAFAEYAKMFNVRAARREAGVTEAGLNSRGRRGGTGETEDTEGFRRDEL